MTTKTRALVLAGYGLNCDTETAYACELAGAAADIVHINSLIDGTVGLSGYQLMVFIGGFSWGDDHGAGVVQAVRMKTRIGDEILEFIEKGNLVLGICNGFQTLANMGLLPGFDNDYTTRSVAVTYNDCGNFQDRWVTMKVDPESPCVFTAGLDTLDSPIRHGEGKFYTDESILETLIEKKQVPVRYALPDGTPADGKSPFNPNGSIYDVAGICDPTGRVFGLMPHPEAYNHWTNHPNWTREKELKKRRGETLEPGVTPGIRVFRNAVGYFQQ